MVATTNREIPGRRPLAATLRSFIGTLLDDLRAERQRAVNRRLMRELPDHLLKDMGISRDRIGVLADPAGERMLRDFAGWR